MDATNNQRQTPAGVLRINTSLGHAHGLYTFGAGVPTTLPRQFDAGLRSNELVPRDLVRVPMGGGIRMAIGATPAYFALHRKPKSPADLMQHRCIRARLPSDASRRWEFARQGESLHIDAPGNLIMDSPRLMHDAARAGRGLAQLAEWYVADHAPFKTTRQH